MELVKLIKGIGEKCTTLEEKFPEAKEKIKDKDDPLEPAWIKGALEILTMT